MEIKDILNTIIKWDCIENLKKIPDKSVDLIFADPPYNMQLKNDLYRPNSTKVDWVDDYWDQFDSFDDYDQFSISWLTECKRILKDTGTIWVIGSYHNIYRVWSIMHDLGFWILNDVIWHKTNPMPNFLWTRFTNATEILLWCTKWEKHKKYTFNHKIMKKYNWWKQMTSVWNIGICIWNERIKWEDWKKVHSTQKPEELLKRVILSSTTKWDIVLDPFFGTGTTGAVAKKLWRNFIWLEREEKYIEVATSRIESIKEEIYEANWIEEIKEAQIKVPFKNLIEKWFLKEWDLLYSKKRLNQSAKILSNWMLDFEWNQASIHKIWAIIWETPSCNWWKFWYTKIWEDFVLIDDLRQDYIKKYLLN